MKIPFLFGVALLALSTTCATVNAIPVIRETPATAKYDKDGDFVGCSVNGSTCVIVDIVDEVYCGILPSGDVSADISTETTVGTDFYHCDATPTSPNGGYGVMQGVYYSHTDRNVLQDAHNAYPNNCGN